MHAFYRNRADCEGNDWQALLRAIEEDPTLGAAYIGHLYESFSERDKAAVAYERALLIRPDFHDARLALRMSYAARDRTAEAVEQIRLLLESVPHWEETVMKMLEGRFPSLVEATRRELEPWPSDE